MKRALAALEHDGYVILEHALSVDMLQHMRAVIDDAIAREATRDVHLVDNLTSRDGVFRAMVTHDAVLPLVEQCLGDDCVLSGTIARTPTRGGGAQALHRDASFWSPTMADIDARLGLTALFPLDDFSAYNGATVVVPGFHRLSVEADPSRAVSIEAPAGSCVLFDLRLLHGGATNYGDAPRRAVFAMYVRGWIKPMVDGRRSTPRDVIDTATPTLRRLLGFERQPVVIAENGRWAIEAAPGATSFYGRPQGAGVYG